MINKVTLIGNLGADPEKKIFDSGGFAHRLSVATADNYKDKTSGEWVKNTDWHTVTIYNRDSVGNLKKGDKVFIDGKIKYRSWEDQNGVKKYATDIVARQIRSLERSESTGSYSGPPVEEPTNQIKDESDLPF